MLPVNAYIDHFISLWERSNTEFPGFGKKYSVEEQKLRELNFEKFQEKIKAFQSRTGKIFVR